ncbi:intraflagellar transport protein 52 homolog isoform X2 [Epinephelus moara]|uniref:intraflagellar transport protein 52 homolog isoform X2 n=1 Tax=Epinephelus moara TaxID=300413 RepID=UPI00214E8196|nr:intraflagellar transport protein 52 homolog isoform X2 [Epinephelus moara]
MEKEQHNNNIVVFNSSKRELFTTNNGYKSMYKRLRAQWKIQSMKEELSLEKLKGVKLWITAGPREKFTASEEVFTGSQIIHRRLLLSKTNRSGGDKSSGELLQR